MILGLGMTFELPILVLFLSLFGIVSPRFLWKNIRYAILIIFIIAAIITPTPDVLTMCVFATPMLVLYLISIGVSYMVHPATRRRRQERLSCGRVRLSFLLSLATALLLAQAAPAQSGFNGARALAYTREFVSIGPRWIGSPGHAKAEAFIQKQFAARQA